MNNPKFVSVILPTYNEEKNIIRCLESLLRGDYPLDKIEFIIADGQSQDNTRNLIYNFSEKNPHLSVKLISNPEKLQGSGLNRAIENVNQKSEVVLRADAHSIYPENYIKKCIGALVNKDVDNVGGVMVPVGNNSMQKAIAYCLSHFLGVGNAKFHLGNESGFVDTVYLGCFKKDVFDRVGLYDFKMTPNEDAELNLRIVKSGGRIYLDKNIRVEYFPRGSVKDLAKQYFRYGQGRCRTFKKHKALTSYRQLVPPLGVVITFLCICLSFFSFLFIIPIFAYFLSLFLVSLIGFLQDRKRSFFLIFLSFIIIHYSWGLGFLKELLFSKNTKI